MRLVRLRSPPRPPEPRPTLRISSASEAQSLYRQTRRASAGPPETPPCCAWSIYPRTQNLKKLHYMMTLNIFCMDSPHVTPNISRCLVVILRYSMKSRQSWNCFCQHLENKQKRPQTCSWFCTLLCLFAQRPRAQCSSSWSQHTDNYTYISKTKAKSFP